MNREEIIEKWCQALESGQYQKGVGKLKDEDGNYCCLGVLCEILELESEPFYDEFLFHYGKESDSEILPSSLARDLSINNCGGFRECVEYQGLSYISLTDLNDQSDITFPEMAQIIRKNFKANNFETLP